MAAVTLPTDLPVLAFPDQAALEEWLDAEHATAPGLYVRLAKKGSGVPSVTYAELVESALCFGWIDGRSQRLDETSYLQRITPRRPRSVWSQKNVAAVEALIAAGRMRPAGLAAVEAAQADGRWDRAYAGPATITVPDDLAAALAAEPAAQEAFAGLDGASRYAVLWRGGTPAPPPHRATAGGDRGPSSAGDAAGADVAALVHAGHRYRAAGHAGVHHLAVADVDAHVADRGVEEDQVAGLQVGARDGDPHPGLRGAGVRQRDPGRGVGVHRQPRAVERVG